MPSRTRITLLGICVCLLVASTGAQGRQNAVPPVEPVGPVAISRADAARALEQVKADPNLGTERTIRTLRWIRDSEPAAPSGWLQWIVGFFRWLGQTARLMVWVAAAILAGLLAFALVRLLQRSSDRAIVGAPTALPTHVRDLDIRPESLPDDIGGGARRLWDAGDRRSALALLYRGLLSRLVHVHRVPIRDSSTEGDCLALAAGHLPGAVVGYAGTLIRAWQRGVYGAEVVDTPAVHALCDGFAAALAEGSTEASSGGTPAGAQS